MLFHTAGNWFISGLMRATVIVIEIKSRTACSLRDDNNQPCKRDNKEELSVEAIHLRVRVQPGDSDWSVVSDVMVVPSPGSHVTAR